MVWAGDGVVMSQGRGRTSSMLRIQFLMLSKDFSLVMS